MQNSSTLCHTATRMQPTMISVTPVLLKSDSAHSGLKCGLFIEYPWSKDDVCECYVFFSLSEILTRKPCFSMRCSYKH